jgi:hypothetical protein
MGLMCTRNKKLRAAMVHFSDAPMHEALLFARVMDGCMKPSSHGH